MSNYRSVPSDLEYDALAALGETHMDFFVSKAVCVSSSGNMYRLMMLSQTLEPINIQEFVVDDLLLERFLPISGKSAIVHNVITIVGMYLDSGEQQLFGGDATIVAARRSTSVLAASTLQPYLS